MILFGSNDGVLVKGEPMENFTEDSHVASAESEEVQRQVELRKLLRFIDCLIGVVVVAICVQGGKRLEFI